MEWVETTGATIDEARLRALDTLGVAYDDAEIEILAEPKKGMLGFGKADARIRARVRPVQPRPKVERRDRGRRKGNDRGGGRPRNQRNDGRAKSAKSDAQSSGRGKRAKGNGNADRGRNDKSAGAAAGATRDGGSQRGRGQGGGRGGQQRGQSQGGGRGERKAEAGRAERSRGRSGEPSGSRSSNQSAGAAAPANREEESMEDTEVIDAAGQASIVEEFLEGLLDAFGADGEFESVEVDDDTYEVRVHGNDLGLMIGPKGATMQAVQEVARTAVQQQADGSLSGRVHLDIGGYRNKRREALADFARRVADTVKESGERKVLEPMPAPDRKVIHDTVAEIDGVATSSEGEDRRRHIVLSPVD